MYKVDDQVYEAFDKYFTLLETVDVNLIRHSKKDDGGTILYSVDGIPLQLKIVIVTNETACVYGMEIYNNITKKSIRLTDFECHDHKKYGKGFTTRIEYVYNRVTEREADGEIKNLMDIMDWITFGIDSLSTKNKKNLK